MSDFPYPGKFTFVDVEIPNLNNDCICAISLIVYDNRREVVRHTELINPKTFFSANNIKIHHILRKDTLNARTLEQFWKDYGQYFEKPYIIGAHNTKSDMSVLNKDLARFGTEITADQYIDTMDIMEKFYYRGNQKKGDLRLNNIADHLGIEIDHHNPESDVNACSEIVKYMAKWFDMDLTPFIKPVTPPKPKPPREPHKPSRRQMKIFLSYTRQQISQKADSTRLNAKTAKQKGDRAYKERDYEGIVFNYEIAAARHWMTPSVYLRLAQTYDELNMHYDAIRVLDAGIRALKSSGQNWSVLKGVEQSLKSIQTSRLEKQKASSSKKLINEARARSKKNRSKVEGTLKNAEEKKSQSPVKENSAADAASSKESPRSSIKDKNTKSVKSSRAKGADFGQQGARSDSSAGKSQTRRKGDPIRSAILMHKRHKKQAARSNHQQDSPAA